VKSFIAHHKDNIIGVLNGIDRMVFRGTLRMLSNVGGFRSFLSRKGVLLKDFGKFVHETSEQLKEASLHEATLANRPVVYLPSAKRSKEEVALKVLAKQPVESGLICVIKAVESCKTYEIHRNRQAKRLELRKKDGKCSYFYHYLLHPHFGLINVRIQTWFPFSIQICLNGREWLSRQMDRMDIGYVRRDNCFTRIDNIGWAQRLMDEQLQIDWPSALGRLADIVFPGRDALLDDPRLNYYWSAHQSEWATDILFENSAKLAAIYPALVRHGITHFSSPDVMRFLGQKVHGSFKGEIISSFLNRPEGVRIKHRVDANSVKLYDKKGSVLRVETTINDPRQFKVYRPVEGGDPEQMQWRPMRKGIADLHRRAKVSQASNDRYLEALAEADTSTPVGPLLSQVCKPARIGKVRVRALRPLDPADTRLLQAVNDGGFVVNGFRNRAIAQILYGPPPRQADQRRSRAAKVTRQLRLLRAHGLIRKLPHTHRYQVSKKGRQIIGALLTLREVSVQQLDTAAA
jgi:hypothetical protein